MSATARTRNRTRGPRTHVPRWAWVVMVLLLLVAAVAVTVAVFAPRGQQSLQTPAPDAAAAPATPTATAAPSTSATTASARADGCLGGPGELDQAILSAQQKAPLTEQGAAAFTATVVQWAMDAPAAPYQEVTAEEVLAADATSAAQASLAGNRELDGSAGTFDFSDGRYYVESYDGTSSIVSYLARATPTLDGVPQGEVLLSGAVHLEAINGVWRYSDLSDERSIADLQRIGTPYSGGC